MATYETIRGSGSNDSGRPVSTMNLPIVTGLTRSDYTIATHPIGTLSDHLSQLLQSLFCLDIIGVHIRSVLFCSGANGTFAVYSGS